jgi:hypothetical protein
MGEPPRANTNPNRGFRDTCQACIESLTVGRPEGVLSTDVNTKSTEGISNAFGGNYGVFGRHPAFIAQALSSSVAETFSIAMRFENPQSITWPFVVIDLENYESFRRSESACRHTQKSS